VKSVIKPKADPVSLYDMSKNSCCRVVNIPNNTLLDSLGISKDAMIIVQNKYAFGGPVLLKVDTALVAIGKDIPSRYWLRRSQANVIVSYTAGRYTCPRNKE